MNGNAPNDEAKSRRYIPRPVGTGNGFRRPNQQQNPQKRQQQQPQQQVESSSPPAGQQHGGRKEAGAQHQPKCQDTQPLPPINLEMVKQLWLEANFIIVLRKRAVQHPNAQFYCKLCNYYCMSFNHCEQHSQEQKHGKNIKAEAKLTTIKNLPTPTETHFEALTSLLTETYNKEGLTDADKIARCEFATEVDKLISENLPGCNVQVYGSSLTGIALKQADLNLDFIVAKDLTAPEMLQEAYQVLSASMLAIDVKSDFNSDIPSIFFTNENKSLNCVLSLNHHDASNTCKLVEMYTNLDPRVKPLGSCFRLWTKLCKIDDIQMAMLPSYSYSLLLIYFLQQLEPPVLPVIKDIKEELPEWKSENTMSLGELWYKLLQFYAVDFPESKNIVCIRLKEPLTKNDKHWTSRKIAIEDPYLLKRNVSRYLVTTTYDYIMSCLLDAYQYFAVPQTDIGPLLGTIRLPMEKFLHLPEVKLNVVRAEQSAMDMMDKDLKRFIKSTENKKVYSVEELERGVNKMGVKEEFPYGFYASKVVTPRVAEAMCQRLRKESYKFDFNAKRYAQEVPVVCNICLMDGHTRNDCPDTYLPPLLKLPPMTSRFLRELDTICKQEMQNWLPSEEEVTERQIFVHSLQQHLKMKFPHVKLELFGSSCNGFGFRKSDLDICLTFSNNPTGEGINDVALFEELGNELKTYEHIQNLLTITTAKVPIIKFTYPRIRVECDISLYNTLAQRNTRMLHLYSQIDRRVKILGYTLKRFAKLCDICDASRGSLSSYAYILMAIYFLQQCDPPVIPVLQELYTTEEQPQVLVEGWNTWFFDDLDRLDTVWSGYGKNTTSVGELWYQLLRFYTEEFDFNEHVISIRQEEKLVRFKKLWNSKCIAIEDPFDLNHNLGSGLSRKMNNFIIKAFRKGRMHFGTPISMDDVSPHYRELREYLFDARYLTEGQVPNDRGCRICKKIGHIARNCPKQQLQQQQQQPKHKNLKPNNQNKPQQQPRRENEPRPLTETQRQPPIAAPKQAQPRPPPLQQPKPQQPFGSQGPLPAAFQQVNGGMGTPSPPLPVSPTKGLPGVAANSSPAFDNFMRLMQQRGAPSMMQVPPGFSPQRPSQPPAPSGPSGHGHMFFHPRPPQANPQHVFPNGMPPSQFPQYFTGAPVAHQMNWPQAGLQGGQQQMYQHQQPLPRGMAPPLGHPQAMPPQQQ
ncbi:terminal uridylyltransferase 4-like [Neocloeon triangulifer]|uniref:terminal uridylyltransferase 4-like n=1 Tax=Neocloeon triangulifer TaxID=2078957 RepID=UPI00286FA934|nr:terminal uridylyltransferase 4-like [Neocloeon triangulifer]